MISKIINKGYEANECQLCKAQFGLLYIAVYALGNWREFTNARDATDTYVSNVATRSRKS